MEQKAVNSIGEVPEGAIPDLNLFMVCRSLNPAALSELPAGYHFRYCREDELDLWKALPFDNPGDAQQYRDFMDDFYDNVYAPRGKEFFERCLLICNEHDEPIATGFTWKVYDSFHAVHWLKVKNEYEGQGLGRALLSEIMRALEPDDYPVYLHTHPSSFRAIKLYADFGYALLTNPIIGSRENQLEQSLPYLKQHMPGEVFSRLEFTSAPDAFLEAVRVESDEREPEF